MALNLPQLRVTTKNLLILQIITTHTGMTDVRVGFLTTTISTVLAVVIFVQ